MGLGKFSSARVGNSNVFVAKQPDSATFSFAVYWVWFDKDEKGDVFENMKRNNSLNCVQALPRPAAEFPNPQEDTLYRAFVATR